VIAGSEFRDRPDRRGRGRSCCYTGPARGSFSVASSNRLISGEALLHKLSLARQSLGRDGSIPTRQRSAVRDHDFAEIATALEMAVGCLGLGERECPIYHGAQPVHGDRPVHHLKIGATTDANRAQCDPAAAQQ
jgi:hypothetical protein